MDSTSGQNSVTSETRPMRQSWMSSIVHVRARHRPVPNGLLRASSSTSPSSSSTPPYSSLLIAFKISGSALCTSNGGEPSGQCALRSCLTRCTILGDDTLEERSSEASK